MSPKLPRYSEAFNQPPQYAPVDPQEEQAQKLVKTGWICVILALFLGICGAFTIAAWVCAIIAMTKGKVGEGVAIIILAPFATAINAFAMIFFVMIPTGMWAGYEATRPLMHVLEAF